MKKVISLGIVLGVLPMFAFANDAGATVFSVLGVTNQIMAVLIPILITLAVIYFIWGVIEYTMSGDEDKKKDARKKIINGLIGLFVIVAFWGIIRLVTSTFGVGPEQLNENAVPCIPSAFVKCGNSGQQNNQQP